MKEHGPDFEWDNANLKHVARHRVTPAEAQEVLRNDPIEVGYDVIEGEGRWTVMGHTNLARVRVVACTFRSGKTRVVTAWPGRRDPAKNICDLSIFHEEAGCTKIRIGRPGS